MAKISSEYSRGILKKRREKRQKLLQALLLTILLITADDISADEERHYARHELDLLNMEEEKFKHNFRFDNCADFSRFLRALRLPDKVICSNGTTVTNEFAVAVVLRRLAYPSRLGDLVDLLGREKSQLSRIFNATIDLIYEEHGHLLESLNQPRLDRSHVDASAEAIYRVTGRYDNVFGFIDGTARAICRPGTDQQDFYSGHHRMHCLKYQSIVLPNGLIANLWGPAEGRSHDCYMVCQSNIRNRLRAKNTEWGRNFCLYGDKGYSLSEEIHTPFKGNITEEENAMNQDMTRARMAVENGFLKVCQCFFLGNYKENQKLLWQQTAKAYIVSALIANCHTCLYGYPLVQNIFGLAPPTLEEYFQSE